jgi:hypothetical protein
VPPPSRLILLLLALAVLAYSCGPHTPSSESSEPGSQAPQRRATNGLAIASSLGVEVRDQVGFTFHVTNNAAKRLELTFPSGQTHDIVVLDTLGREVWRWSEGRLFTQSIQNKVLDTSETLTYEAEWTPGELRGRYVAEASLMSQNHPLKKRVEFSVP